MANTQELLIGDVARMLGIKTSAIRYYEELGLLPPAGRSESGYRLFGDADVERVWFIRRARELDFSLDEIREILAFREHGDVPCSFVLARIRDKIADAERRIADLAGLRDELTEIHSHAALIAPSALATSGRVCRVIENTVMTDGAQSSRPAAASSKGAKDHGR